MGVLRDGRHRKLQGSMLFLGSHGASAQTHSQAAVLLGPQSLGFLVSVPHPNSGHGPISSVLHCNTDHEPPMAYENPGQPGPKPLGPLPSSSTGATASTESPATSP